VFFNSLGSIVLASTIHTCTSGTNVICWFIRHKTFKFNLNVNQYTQIKRWSWARLSQKRGSVPKCGDCKKKLQGLPAMCWNLASLVVHSVLYKCQTILLVSRGSLCRGSLCKLMGLLLLV
jgi:hypothetical protein